jgi:hypothetical protein
MTTAARVLAIVCGVLFSLSALSALVLFNVERRAFDPKTYTNALAGQGFYARLPALLGQILAQSPGAQAAPFVRQLSADDWASIIRTLLPPEQLRAISEDAISQIFAYLNGESPQAGISLVALKQALSSPPGAEAAIRMIHSQPECDAAQLAKFVGSFGQVICDPPQEVLDLIRPALQAQLAAAAALLPDRVSILQADAGSPHLNQLRFVRLLMRLSPLLPLAFLFSLTLLAVRSLKDWLKWWGWPFLAAGVLGALSGFGGAPVLRLAAEDFLARRVPISLPPELAQAVRGVVEAALREMLRPAGWEGLALGAAGLACLAAEFLITRREQARRRVRSEARTQVV